MQQRGLLKWGWIQEHPHKFFYLQDISPFPKFLCLWVNGETPSWGYFLPCWVGGTPFGLRWREPKPFPPSVPCVVPGFSSICCYPQQSLGRHRKGGVCVCGRTNQGMDDVPGSAPCQNPHPQFHPGARVPLSGLSEPGPFLVTDSSNCRNIFLAGIEMRKLKVCGWAAFFFPLFFFKSTVQGLKHNSEAGEERRLRWGNGLINSKKL